MPSGTNEREREQDKDFCTAIIANSGSVFKRNINFAHDGDVGKTNASIPRDDTKKKKKKKKKKERNGNEEQEKQNTKRK